MGVGKNNSGSQTPLAVNGAGAAGSACFANVNFVSADNIYSGATFGAQMIAVERRYTGRASVPA